MSIGIGQYDVRWLAVAFLLVVLAAWIAISRRLLAAFSRKRLLETAPETRKRYVEAVLDREDDLQASLRTVDLLFRLLLVLSLAFGRIAALPRGLGDMGFGAAIVACLVLAVETILALLIVLEVVPGIVARVRPEVRLLRRLWAIDRIDRALTPLRRVAKEAIGRTAIFLGGSAERPSADVLEEEILSAAEEGEREGLLKSRDIDMIESIISYGEVEVSDVMTPRTEMVSLDVNDPFEHNLRIAIECGHSRIPVYRESKDNILGLLYVKDLLRYWDRKDELSLEKVLRRPHFVPRGKKIGELFQEFRTQRFHIAIILDDFGGTSGLITIEDIIEEIVGEIVDEYEKEQKPPIRHVAPNRVDVDASLHIDDVNDQLEIDIPSSERYDTLGGFVVSGMGRIPKIGEHLDYDSMRFEVTAADERRIHRVEIRLPEGGSEADRS